MSDAKPTNPKDLIGTNKLPLHLVPEIAVAWLALAMLSGALKYGRENFQEMGVQSSVYVAAAKRHLDMWFSGEDLASDSGVHHLGHAMACLAIILDAASNGKLIDDRRFNGAGYLRQLEQLNKLVENMRKQYADNDPKHYSRLLHD